MVTLITPYTLERAQNDYRAREADFRRQSAVGAPGLGKGSTTNQLIDLGFISSKAEGVYEFSSRLKALAERCPEYTDDIIPKINEGILVDPKFVQMAYEQDRTDFGFGIDSKLNKGQTVIYDGLPRQAGLPMELNQVEMLRRAHGGQTVFDLATIMRHSDNYIPVVRQLLREFEHTCYSGENGRKDTFKAVKRVVGYNAKLPDLATEIKGISAKTIEFHADDVNPMQTAFLYLALAANDGMLEQEVREMNEFHRLGSDVKNQMPSIMDRVNNARHASQVHGGDEKAEKSLFLLEEQINTVLWAQKDNLPFDEFVDMWKQKGYYDLELE